MTDPEHQPDAGGADRQPALARVTRAVVRAWSPVVLVAAGGGRASGRARRRVVLWWRARGQTLRQVVRTLVLLVITGLISGVLGLATATASAPVGPHRATWEVTLSSTVTVDLGPLGSASMDSPAGPVGVKVILGEIPGEASTAGDSQELSSDVLGQALSADGAAYVSLFSHPDLTIDRGVRALAEDAVRRAGLVESIILCLVVAARLAAGGRLRDAVRAALSRDSASALMAATATVTVVALVVPAVRPEPVQGSTVEALAGTPLAQARLSGRLADIVQAYGTDVTGFLEDNEAFYTAAQANLRAAWRAADAVDGTVDVTAAEGQATTADLEEARRAALRQSAGTALDSEPPAATPGTTTPSSEPSAAPAMPATGPWAVARNGAITAVLSTDLHCNLDVIAFAGVLDEVAQADIHMDDGDLTMTGSEPEQVCVDALNRAVPAGVARVATVGNHDSEATAERLRALGWTVTDGTVQNVGGLSVLGDDDVERTTAAGTAPRGSETAEQLGARLAATSCRAAAGSGVDVVLVHRPQTFGPLASQGCAPLLVAGHVHVEHGMTVSSGGHLEVAQLVSGAGKGGTSIGQVTEDAYLHVLSFNADGRLLAWRAVVLHPDASVTVGAWQALPEAVAGPTGTSGRAEDAYGGAAGSEAPQEEASQGAGTDGG